MDLAIKDITIHLGSSSNSRGRNIMGNLGISSNKGQINSRISNRAIRNIHILITEQKMEKSIIIPILVVEIQEISLMNFSDNKKNHGKSIKMKKDKDMRSIEVMVLMNFLRIVKRSIKKITIKNKEPTKKINGKMIDSIEPPSIKIQ